MKTGGNWLRLWQTQTSRVGTQASRLTIVRRWDSRWGDSGYLLNIWEDKPSFLMVAPRDSSLYVKKREHAREQNLNWLTAVRVYKDSTVVNWVILDVLSCSGDVKLAGYVAQEEMEAEIKGQERSCSAPAKYILLLLSEGSVGRTIAWKNYCLDPLKWGWAKKNNIRDNDLSFSSVLAAIIKCWYPFPLMGNSGKMVSRKPRSIPPCLQWPASSLE